MSIENMIFLDVETLPDDRPETLARLRAAVTAPATYKKPESIEAWMAENADATAAEQLGKTGLDGLYGRLCVIGFAVGERPVQAVRWLPNIQTEAEFIRAAFAAIDEAAQLRGYTAPLEAVGHNIQFDMRFLFARAVRYGIPVPRSMRKAFGPDARYATHDTMTMWAGWGGRVKLKALAAELLGDTCDDIDGSQVAAEWARDPNKVVQHCIEDVERTRKLFLMMRAVL